MNTQNGRHTGGGIRLKRSGGSASHFGLKRMTTGRLRAVNFKDPGLEDTERVGWSRVFLGQEADP